MEEVELRERIEDANEAVAGMTQSSPGIVASAPDDIQPDLNTVSSIIAPLKAFNSISDALIHPDTKVVLNIFTRASKMILDQSERDFAVQDLLKKLSEVYTFMNEDGRLADVPTRQALYVKLAQQILECADFIVHYSESRSAWEKLAKNVLKETDAMVQSYNIVLDTLMQQLRVRATSVSVDFILEPTLIPSTDIQKLESSPDYSGGFSDVWKCSMSTPSGTRPVAVRSFRIPQGSDGGMLHIIHRRIRREAYVWIKMTPHNHILHFEGVTDGFGELPALVSLWMENGPLSDYLKKEYSTLSDDRKMGLIQQVAAGLGHLHGKDIVHGDLTGTNILVDGSGNIRIAGFGLSMIAAESGDSIFDSVQTGITRWMAPEFLDYAEDLESSLKPTKRGDIYSFGCIMLQILSGEEPYSQMKLVIQVIRAIMVGSEPFRGIEITMDDANRQLSSRCLSREPEERPSVLEITTIVGGPEDGNGAKPTSQQPEDFGSIIGDTEPLPEGSPNDYPDHESTLDPPPPRPHGFLTGLKHLLDPIQRGVQDVRTRVRPNREELQESSPHHPDPSIGRPIHPQALLGRFYSLFHRSHPITNPSRKPEQSSRRSVPSHQGPSVVEVALQDDKKALYVGPHSEGISDPARPPMNPTWWSRCILFLCCASASDINRHQQTPSGTSRHPVPMG